MNMQAVGRIAWKDHRMLRGFWIALAVIALAADAVQWLQIEPALQAHYWVVSFALVAPALFAATCGAALFAAEQEDRTYDFLRGQPIRAGELVAGRALHALLATGLMALVLWTYSWWLTGWMPLTAWGQAVGWRPEGLWVHWGLAAVEGFCWGIFFSVLMRRPLVAACLAIGAASLSVQLLAGSIEPHSPVPYPFENYLRAIPRRGLLTALLFALDQRLVSNWLRGTELVSWEKFRTAKEAATLPSRARRFSRSAVTQREPFVVLGRLIWQHVRQLARPVVGILAAGVLFAAALFFIGGFKGLFLGPVFSCVVLVASLLGTYAFLPDKVGCRYRFLAERGLRPTAVWISRQSCGAAMVLLSLVVVVVAMLDMAYGGLISVIDRGLAHGRRDVESRLYFGSLFLPAALMAYSSGQLGSMLFRTGILAGFCSLVGTVIFCGWAWLMSYWDISWSWSVVPIPFVLLAASWLRTGDWLLERNSVRNWSRVALVILLPLAAIFSGMVAQRVYEIPAVRIEPLAGRYSGPVPEEARQTAWMYEQAGTKVVPWSSDDEDEDVWPIMTRTVAAGASVRDFVDKHATDVPAWLETNRDTLELFLEASERPFCAVSLDARNGLSAFDTLWPIHLLTLAKFKAIQLERNSDLTEAFRWHMAALRYLAHLRMGMPGPKQLRALALEPTVLEDVRQWAGLSGQTPVQLRDAATQLEKWMDSLPPPVDTVVTDHRVMKQVIQRDPAAMHSGMTPNEAFRIFLLDVVTPWERVRADRVADYFTWTRLRRIGLLADGYSLALENDTRRLDHWIWTSHTVPFRHFWPDQVLESFLPGADMQRRATRLLLWIKAWQLEHGEYPEDLEAVVGDRKELLLSDSQWFARRVRGRFEYLRDGFPVPVKSSAVVSDVPPGKPVIWSHHPGPVPYRLILPGSSLGESIFGELRFGNAVQFETDRGFGHIFLVP